MTTDDRRNFREFIEHIIEDGQWQWDDTGENMTADAAAFLAALDSRDEQKGRLVQLQKERNHALDCCDRQSEQIKVLRDAVMSAYHEGWRNGVLAWESGGRPSRETETNGWLNSASREALALTAPDADGGGWRSMVKRLVNAVEALPVEDWVEVDGRGDPKLVGYVMQARGEWDEARTAAKVVRDKLFPADTEGA